MYFLIPESQPDYGLFVHVSIRPFATGFVRNGTGVPAKVVLCVVVETFMQPTMNTCCVDSTWMPSYVKGPRFVGANYACFVRPLPVCYMFVRTTSLAL